MGFKTKKGTAHVEMIISFAIFISFVVFMFIIFKPLKIASASTSRLELTSSKILKSISTDLIMSSIILNSSSERNYFNPATEDCFKLSFSIPNKIIIKDKDFNIVDAKKSGDDILLKHTGSKFYRIYSSKELKERDVVASGCNDVNSDGEGDIYDIKEHENYSTGVIRLYKKVSYSKLKSFFQDYNTGYATLKETLNLNNDFNVFVRDDEGKIINDEKDGIEFKAEKFKPKIEIMAKDISIEILNEDANITFAIMNIQVWS